MTNRKSVSKLCNTTNSTLSFHSEPIKLEPTLGELQADEDDFWGDGSATAPIEALEEGSVLNPRQIKRKKNAAEKKKASSGGGGANEKPKKRTSWPCVFCEEVFPTNAALRKHQDEAHEGFHDKCEQCDIKFFKVADLQVKIWLSGTKSSFIKALAFVQVHCLVQFQEFANWYT